MIYADKTKLITNADEDVVVIPTNLTLRKDGALVMGAGLAKWFRQHMLTNSKVIGEVNVDHYLGDAYAGGDTGPVFCGYDGKHHFVSFPTKKDWRDDSDLVLIERNLIKLADAIDNISPTGSLSVAVPKFGCGLGKLDWNVVRPLMFKYLDDKYVCYG